MTETNQPKKQVIQINKETGVSTDYINEVMLILGAVFDRYPLGPEKFERMFKLAKEHAPVLKYTQRYSTEKFENVVNDKNRTRIQALDSIVDELNSMLSLDSRDIPHYKVLLHQFSEQMCDEPIKNMLGGKRE